MLTEIIVVGAGGHTRSLLTLVDKSVYTLVGIYDDNFLGDERIIDFPVLGKIKDMPEGIKIVLSIGDNNKRAEMYNNYRQRILQSNLIHKSAILETHTSIGNSNQIFAKVVINAGAKIGQNNIINTGCILEHEVMTGSHNHISVNSTICGRVKIGNNCFIGAGAVIIDKLTICDNVIIGANSVVINNISESGVYVGNPARRIR